MVNFDKNARFFEAIDYLYKKRLVISQKDIAEKIGITETSLSRLRSGQRGVSYETLRKLNESFDHIFNMPYFRGESDVMLIADLNKEQPRNIEADGSPSLIELAAQLIKEVEVLRRDLQEEREQTRQLNAELTTAIHRLNSITPSKSYLIASEPTDAQ